MLFTLLLVACKKDGVPREGPPVFEVTAEGNGPPNAAPLLPLHVGTVLATEDSELNHPYTWAVESPILRGGRPLHRMVFPDGVLYLESTTDGILAHGSTVNQWEEHPLLLIPATVRDGMTWEVSSTGGQPDWEMTATAQADGRWVIGRTHLQTGETRGGIYQEGVGLVEASAGDSDSRRRYVQGRVRTTDAARDVLDPGNRISLSSLGVSVPFDARHLSVFERGGTRTLSVQSVFLESMINMDLLRESAVWATTSHCLTLTPDGDVAPTDSVLEGCESVIDDDGQTRLLATHAGLSADRILWGPPEQIAFGGYPTFSFDNQQVTLDFVGRDSAGHGPISQPYQDYYVDHLGRAQVVDLAGGQPNAFMIDDPWVTRQYLRTTAADAAVRSIAETVGDADAGDVLLEDGLGGWTQGALDADGRPAGHPTFAFQKTGMPHLRITPDGREGLLTDTDGALWLARPGDTPLSFLGFIDLPDGHILTGAVRLGPVGGAVDGDQILIATTSGRHAIIDTANGRGPDDTTETHFHTATLPTPTPYDAQDGMLGVAHHAADFVWVCEPDGVTSATNLGDALDTDEGFASCRRFAEPDGPVEVDGTTLLGQNLLTGFTQTGLLAHDGVITDTRFTYTETGMALDTSPFAGIVRGANVGVTRRTGYRDPWTFDLWGWNYTVGLFDQIHMPLDGPPTSYPDAAGIATITPFPRAVGGGGRLVEDAAGTWIQDVDGLRTPVPDGTFLAWNDGRSCSHAVGESIVCIGSDGVERRRAVGIPDFESLNRRARALAGEQQGYLLFDDHIFRFDPDTMELTALDTVDYGQDDEGIFWVTDKVTQGVGGRLWYTDGDGARSSILGDTVAKAIPPDGGDTYRTVGPDGLTEVSLTEVPARYVPAPPGTRYPFGGFDLVLGEQAEMPSPAGPLLTPNATPWTYAGSTVVTPNETVVFDPTGSGYLTVRDTGIVRIAWDGTETVSPWPGDVPDTDWFVLGQGRRHAVVFTPDPASDPTLVSHLPMVVDLTTGTTTTVSTPAFVYNTQGRWTQLSEDGATLIHPELIPLDPALFTFDLQLHKTDLTTNTTTLVSTTLPPDDTFNNRMALSPNGAVLIAETDDDPLFPTSFIDTVTGATVAHTDLEGLHWAGSFAASDDGWLAITEGPPAVGMAYLERPTPFYDVGSVSTSAGEFVSMDGRDVVVWGPGLATGRFDPQVDGLQTERPNAYYIAASDVLLSPDGNSIGVVVPVLESGVPGTTEVLRFTR
jgi:hypothetical protein